jgi:hypothetical protein
MMAKITVLIPDGESSSRELYFEATRYLERPPEEGKPLPPPLDLYAGRKVIATFPFGAWMGVWYTDKKGTANDRRW